jgi:HAD superfamily phosphoserine phosphatase-like hydrolase
LAKLDTPRIYLFDLDSTITKEELLARIGTLNGTSELLRKTTTEAMLSNGSFSKSFIERIDLLSEIPLEEAQSIVETVPILEDLMNWIQSNNQCVYLVTGNLDIWLQKFLKKYKLKAFTSKAILKDGKVCVTEILDKVQVLGNFATNEVVYVGDGSNDVEIMRNSDIGILTEIVHKAPTSLWDVADFAVKDEDALCKLLSRL